MALEHRLELKVLQKLILTPQLQQAIKLLQMPQLELSQMLRNELVENPFLEETPEESADEETNPGDNEHSKFPENVEAPLEKLMGFSVEEYFDSRSYDGKDLGYFSPDANPIQSMDQFVSEGSDLYDHLIWQLRFCDAREDCKLAAEVVIGNIDDNGYLQSSEEDIANHVGCSLENARKAIDLVQSFDPPGIGARSLKECLLFQLDHLGLKHTLVENLIENNLKDIERRKFQRLAQQYQCSLDDIKQAIRVIEGLEPKPGRGMSGSQTIYIKPDVYVIRDEDNFRIVLSDENMPSLRINSYYKKLLSNKNTLQKEEKEYLNERLRSAVWLLKSLDHRNKTIYRVTESILNFQKPFFENGVAHMNPLNLKDVARELDMHESTISRTTSNKYLSCSHGLFNFRYFFSSSIRSESGSISSTKVKSLVKKIISEENSLKPLSDQKIANVLKDMNIKVARRTIAKYREEMRIVAQNLRKKLE
jgi:RNA polymerase sigma-54 factor